MSTTAHGTPQIRWRCEENLFEGTGAFSSTMHSKATPTTRMCSWLAVLTQTRSTLLSQVESLLLPSNSACLEQTDTREEQGAKESKQQRMEVRVACGQFLMEKTYF